MQYSKPFFPCFSHSSAQALQISTHNRQISSLHLLPRHSNSAVERHRAAHSKSSWMHLLSSLTLGSFKHSVTQRLQATAQALQASMQFSTCWFNIMKSFYGLDMG